MKQREISLRFFGMLVWVISGLVSRESDPLSCPTPRLKLGMTLLSRWALTRQDKQNLSRSSDGTWHLRLGVRIKEPKTRTKIEGMAPAHVGIHGDLIVKSLPITCTIISSRLPSKTETSSKDNGEARG